MLEYKNTISFWFNVDCAVFWERRMSEGQDGSWWAISTFILEYPIMFTLISTALHLQLTVVGSSYIAGAQSRYFMPVNPLLLLGVLLLVRCFSFLENRP